MVSKNHYQVMLIKMFSVDYGIINPLLNHVGNKTN